MIRCLNCKKYLEIRDGKPSSIKEVLGIDIYRDKSDYDYLIVIPYKPKTVWRWIVNLFRPRKWEITGGIAVLADSYAAAYTDSIIYAADIKWNPVNDLISYANIWFMAHASGFDNDEFMAGFVNAAKPYPEGRFPEGAVLLCTSCDGISSIQEAIRFWNEREQYYGDLPLCACGGEIMNELGHVPGGGLRAEFKCERCGTAYDKKKFGDSAVDITED